MKPFKLLISLLLLTLLLASCGGGSTKEEAPPAEEREPASSAPAEPEPEPEPEPDPLQLALECYKEIAAKADTYEYFPEAELEPTGVYRYALVPMTRQAELPALLLEQETTFGIANSRVFQYDAESGTVFQPTDVLQEGVGEAGGFRGTLELAGDGWGILSSSFSSGTGAGSVVRRTLEDGELHTSTIWCGSFFKDDEYRSIVNTVPIEWHDVSDLAALDDWTLPDFDGGSLATEERIVFTGVVDTFSYEKAVELQGMPDPNAAWSDHNETFHMIVLDEPQAMTLDSMGGGRYEGTVSLIMVPEWLTEWDGQHLTFAMDPDSASWPSDAAIPVGQPWGMDFLILGPA